MSDEKIQYEVHDYDPLNKYIDERSRIKRTRSVWGYTRSLALFLIALGIFLILAAYAYHIFKKPHDSVRSDTSVSEDSEKQINQEIANNGLEDCKKLKPSPFYNFKTFDLITPSNYEDHLEKLKECDWIIEAIYEIYPSQLLLIVYPSQKVHSEQTLKYELKR